GSAARHPVLAVPGWWRRPSRMLHARARREDPPPPLDAPPIVLTGATGTLGRAFARIRQARGLACRPLPRAELDTPDAEAVPRAELDIADAESGRRALDVHAPWAVVNAAGYVRVDDAERDAVRCFRENAEGPAQLARACARDGVALVTFSSDLVFDGRRDAPY